MHCRANVQHYHQGPETLEKAKNAIEFYKNVEFHSQTSGLTSNSTNTTETSGIEHLLVDGRIRK